MLEKYNLKLYYIYKSYKRKEFEKMRANIVGIKRMEFTDKSGKDVKFAKLQIVSSFPLSDELSRGLAVSECSIKYDLADCIPKVPCSAILDFDTNGRLLDLDIEDDTEEKVSEE